MCAVSSGDLNNFHVIWFFLDGSRFCESHSSWRHTQGRAIASGRMNAIKLDAKEVGVGVSGQLKGKVTFRLLRGGGDRPSAVRVFQIAHPILPFGLQSAGVCPRSAGVSFLIG